VNSNELVDTVGAGDAFVGGFLAGLITGSDVSRCVALGHSAARLIVGRKACDLPIDQSPPDNLDLSELRQRRRLRSCECSNAAG
jgi:sugar/nucleoside kinase (ribokinase family)